MAPVKAVYPNFKFGSLRLKSQDVMERVNGSKKWDEVSDRSDVNILNKKPQLNLGRRESCDQSQVSTVASQMFKEESPKLQKRKLKKDLTEIKDKESDEALSDSSDDDTETSEEDDTNSFNYFYRNKKAGSRGKSEEKNGQKF